MKTSLRIPLQFAFLTGFILAGAASRFPVPVPTSGSKISKASSSHSTSSKAASTVTSLRFSMKIPRAAPCRQRKQSNACLINISLTW